MKTNREIRAEAWTLLWKGGWFWRLATVGLVLTGAVWTALGALAAAYRTLEISTLQDFAVAWQNAAASGLGYTASSNGAMARMIAASLFQGFVQDLLTGIAAFGLASLVLSAVRGGREGWLGRGLAGFSAPFTMFWLMFGVQVRVGCWMFLAALPAGVLIGLNPVIGGLAAALVIFGVLTWILYRYRNVWYLRVEHPDWGAGHCIAGSIEMMKGWKMRAVRLDCSFWLSLSGSVPILLAALWALRRVQAAGFAGLTGLDIALFAGLGLVTAAYLAVIGGSFALAHAIFYREMISERETIE